MIQIKKTILTLVALLAVTTGAWATDAYEEFTTTASWTSYDQTADHFRVTGSYGFPQGLSIGTSHNYSITIAALNSETISKVEMTIGDMGTWNDGDVISSTAGSVSGSYAVNGTITVDNPNASTVTLSAGERSILIKTLKVYYTEGSSASAVTVAWTAASKTGTFDMPGGNVELEPEYYSQAALTAAPTAINDVPATTDGAIVKAGTVANIGETETAQGTVMYYVSTTALDDAALLALDADKWTADVPTAADLAQGQAYVYYYVRGNDSDTDDENFSDGDILSANALTVTIAAAPTYAVTFADDTAEPDKWTASPAADVTKGQPVTVTYTGTKKVLGVKAEKKAAAAPKASEATASDYGKVVCDKGHLHDAKTAVPDGCTAVAVFAYIDGGNNRIAIALQDGEAATWYTLTTDGANNNTLCSVPGTWTVTAPTDAEWFVGTKAIYEAIFTNLGSTTGDSDGKTYDDNVNAYITTVGGKALSSGYWSTSEKSESIGWDFGSGYWYNDYKTYGLKVRPVLAW